MTINSKQNCIHDLNASLTRTANWRRALQTKFPNDPRNGRAAERLDQLATETKDLSEEAWDELQKFYSWASGKWSDAVSRASRQIEFRHVDTFPAFTSGLHKNPSRYFVGTTLMASLSTASLAEVASKPKFDKNTLALKKINDAWKGNSVSAAYSAAMDIGMLVAGCMVPYEEAKDNGFEVRRVDEKWWSTVYEAFQSGRSSLATTADLHAGNARKGDTRLRCT